jgi:hypothetical protein
MFGFLKRKKTKEVKVHSCKRCPFYYTWIYHGNNCSQYECTIDPNKWTPSFLELPKAYREDRIADKCPLKNVKAVVVLGDK